MNFTSHNKQLSIQIQQFINSKNMRKNTTPAKSPNKIITVIGSNTRYDITSNKVLTNIEIASSTGTATSQGRFSRKSNRYEILRNQHKNHKQVYMAQLLQELFQKRKRYSFQQVKLVYLFPDQSFSQDITVNSYDRLFYQDQHIHTIVKIYETKQMQAKIWAFLNLKTLHKRRKLEKFTTRIENVQRKLVLKTEKSAFDHLHLYSIKIAPQKTVTVTRMEPIVTRIEPKVYRYEESVKTQRIERPSIIHRVQTNQVIRLSESQVPSVKRILLTPDDFRAAYSTSSSKIKSTTNINTNTHTYQTQQPSRIYYPTIPTKDHTTQKQKQKQLTTTKQFHNTHTHTHTYTTVTQPQPSQITTTIYKDTKIIEPIRVPSTTIYSNQATTTKKIEPVQVRTVPVVHSYRHVDGAEVKINQLRGSRVVHPYGYDYLVHTVQGDCTINIFNADTQQASVQVKERSTVRSKSTGKLPRHSFTTTTPQNPDSIYHHPHTSCCHCSPISCHSNLQHCQPTIPHFCHSASKIYTPSISSCHNLVGCHGHGYGCSVNSPYFIEDRIQYLRKLEEINNRMDLSKRFSKD